MNKEDSQFRFLAKDVKMLQRGSFPVFGKGGMEFKGGKGNGKGKGKCGDVGARRPANVHVQIQEDRFIVIPKKKGFGHGKGSDDGRDRIIMVPKKQRVKTLHDMMEERGKTVINVDDVFSEVKGGGVGVDQDLVEVEPGSADFPLLMSAEYTDDASAEYHTVYGKGVAGEVDEALTQVPLVVEELGPIPVTQDVVTISEKEKKVSDELVVCPVANGASQQDDPVPSSEDAVAYDCLKRACADHGMSYPSLKEFLRNSTRGTLTEKKKKGGEVEALNKKRMKEGVVLGDDSGGCRKKRIVELKEKISMLKKKKEKVLISGEK